MKGCPRMSDAQKTGAGKKSKAMKTKFATNAEFRKLQSEGVLAKWKQARYRKKISAARKEQHAKGKGGQGGKEPKK
jgi:hypothetical protein